MIPFSLDLWAVKELLVIMVGTSQGVPKATAVVMGSLTITRYQPDETGTKQYVILAVVYWKLLLGEWKDKVSALSN